MTTQRVASRRRLLLALGNLESWAVTCDAPAVVTVRRFLWGSSLHSTMVVVMLGALLDIVADSKDLDLTNV